MDAGGPCPVTHQSHISRVTAKLADILLDPVQGGDLVQESEVARGFAADARSQKS